MISAGASVGASSFKVQSVLRALHDNQIEIGSGIASLCRSLHVSLAADIVQVLGTSSVPVVVAGSVLGVFELGERLASQRAKDALSKWRLTFDVRQVGALPDGTRELFAKIFGERHFSLKCFIRSAGFSLDAITLLGILYVLISPKSLLPALLHWQIDTRLSLALWLLWSIIIGYISLLKTRFILSILTQIKSKTMVVAASYFSYRLYSIYDNI